MLHDFLKKDLNADHRQYSYNFICALILGRHVKPSFDSWKGVEKACSHQRHITTCSCLPASKLHWFDFALMFVIKCVIKLPWCLDAKSPWLNLFSVCPMFYFKWVLKSPYLTFLHCVFSNVYSNCVFGKMYSHTGCIC